MSAQVTMCGFGVPTSAFRPSTAFLECSGKLSFSTMTTDDEFVVCVLCVFVAGIHRTTS
jgi:hypothetical protein